MHDVLPSPRSSFSSNIKELSIDPNTVFHLCSHWECLCAPARDTLVWCGSQRCGRHSNHYFFHCFGYSLDSFIFTRFNSCEKGLDSVYFMFSSTVFIFKIRCIDHRTQFPCQLRYRYVKIMHDTRELLFSRHLQVYMVFNT